MKFFNAKVWLFAALFFALFSSCEKDKEIAPTEAAFSTTAPANESDYRAVRTVLLTAMNQEPVREFIKSEAIKRVTYDYEVVYGMVKEQSLSNGQTLEGAMLAAEASLLREGKLESPVMAKAATEYPLLSINVPLGLASWDAATFTPPVLVNPEDNLINGKVSALYADGRVAQIDPLSPPNHAVIVVQDNERMNFENGAYVLDRKLVMSVAPKIGTGADKFIEPLECFMIDMEEECVVWTGGGPGNPPPPTGGQNSCREEDEWEMSIIMRGIRMENISSFETFGRPELRLRVFGALDNNFLTEPQGELVADGLWTPRRGDVNQNWTDQNDHLEYWFENFGEQLTFRWDEEDGGSNEDINFSFTLTFQGQNFGASVNFPRARRDDYIGRAKVYKTKCERQFNAGGALRFRLSY